MALNKHALDALIENSLTAGGGLQSISAIVTNAHGPLYIGARGVREVGSSVPMSPETELTMFSATKAVTATSALQLVEDGQLELNIPARTYVPSLGDVQVLEGFTSTGEPMLRPPKRDITTRMLMLHTAGFAYDNFNHSYRRLVEDGRLASAGDATRRSLSGPLLFDPGDNWEYGLNMDWVGQVIENVAGKRLSAFMTERIFQPLGMSSTAFVLTEEMRASLAPVHARGENGSIHPLDFVLPQNAEIDMGGHGLYSTILDFAKFLRIWVGDGTGEGGVRILRPETIEAAAQNGLGEQLVRPLPGAVPFMTHDIDLFPGAKLSWAMSFLRNEETLQTGRPPGGLGWVGMANLYFWIDRATGIGGLWSANLLPLADPDALAAYLGFETLVYK